MTWRPQAIIFEKFDDNTLLTLTNILEKSDQNILLKLTFTPMTPCIRLQDKSHPTIYVHDQWLDDHKQSSSRNLVTIPRWLLKTWPKFDHKTLIKLTFIPTTPCIRLQDNSHLTTYVHDQWLDDHKQSSSRNLITIPRWLLETWPKFDHNTLIKLTFIPTTPSIRLRDKRHPIIHVHDQWLDDHRQSSSRNLIKIHYLIQPLPRQLHAFVFEIEVTW